MLKKLQTADLRVCNFYYRRNLECLRVLNMDHFRLLATVTYLEDVHGETVHVVCNAAVACPTIVPDLMGKKVK